MKKYLLALTAFSFVVSSAPVIASPCKDAKGKFMKCPTKPAKPKTCRDA
jgi:hypothetical protein